MSRWRPPPEKSTALVTRAGHEQLKAELDELWRVKRPEVVRALAAGGHTFPADYAGFEQAI